MAKKPKVVEQPPLEALMSELVLVKAQRAILANGINEIRSSMDEKLTSMQAALNSLLAEAAAVEQKP